MEQKDALLLLILFAAAEDRALRDTLSSALAFYRDNRDMLTLLFAPSKAQKRDGADAPPPKADEAVETERPTGGTCAESESAAREETLDPALVHALFKLRALP